MGATLGLDFGRARRFAEAYEHERFPVTVQHVAVAVFLLSATFGIHFGALDMFWSGDDGFHLDNATRLRPDEYFLSPRVSAEVSGNSISPWNTLTYAIGIAIFGLDPWGHHLHILFILYLSAIATYALVRLWTQCGAATVAAVVYLGGLPTIHVSHELMSGHYLYGLLFAIISTICFVRHLRTTSLQSLMLASVFYLLAVACKEIFVPLPIALAVLPENEWRRRVHGLVPLGAVLLCYLFWRYSAFGSFLGPRWNYVSDIGSYGQLFTIYRMFYGLGPASDIAGAITAAAVLVCSVSGWRKERSLFVPIVLALVLLPLVPLAVTQWLTVWNGRYAYLPWWIIAIGIGLLISRHAGLMRLTIVCLASFVFLLAVRTGAEHSELIRHSWISQYYRFIADSKGDEILLLRENGRIWNATLLNGYKKAERRVNPLAPQRAEVVMHPLQMIGAAPLVGRLHRTDRNDGQVRKAQSEDEARAWIDEFKDVVDFVVIRPPYGTSLTLPSGGYVDHIQSAPGGDAIEIIGWIPFSDAERVSFTVITPIPIVKTKVRRSIPRPDVAQVTQIPSLANSGFSLTLTYDSRTAAHLTNDLICVFASSPSHGATVLSNRFNGHCSKFADARKPPQ